MTEPDRPDDLIDLREGFDTPPAASRPTPLYWWSGTDLDRDRLSKHLALLAAKGVGGTIVGYAHLPDTSLDYGDPQPFSEAWWQLFTWFAEQCATRGMSVGIQDYGVIGPVLREVAPRVVGLGGGSLSHHASPAEGGVAWRRPLGEHRLVSVAVWPDGSSSSSAITSDVPSFVDGVLEWMPPSGRWIVSIVTSTRGRIGGVDTDFDPLHPLSGASVIEHFYEPFARRLGAHLGSTLTTFFQDELDLGVVMPMWNDAVAEASVEAGFSIDTAIHSLFVDSPDAARYRAFYRDTVVRMLEQNYFEPIYQWHEAHGTQLVMDQLSRGDLRVGHHHYADFLQTMKWYHGPGNDDPDLSTEHNTTAFRISGSIAHLHDRPLVVNEAFHSSGWGVTPADIVRGANVGFVSGANHLILHGLYYSTEGGWWEWAAPDFHFRQPWWRHSERLWEYIARVSFVLRAGRNVADVALVDPTVELDLIGGSATSPELAHRLLADLGSQAVNADLVPMAYFAGSIIRDDRMHIASAEYRAVVVPGLSVIRADALRALGDFVRAGGTVIASGRMPTATEFGPVDPSAFDGWLSTGAEANDVVAMLDAHLALDISVTAPGIAVVHRRLSDSDLYFCVNVTDAPIDAALSFSRPRHHRDRLERWDLWSGAVSVVREHDLRIVLQPGESDLLVSLREGADAIIGDALDRASPTRQPVVVSLGGPWSVEPLATLDNSDGDVEFGSEEVGVESWHIECSDARSDRERLWSPAVVRDGRRFWVLGPVGGDQASALASHFSTLDALDVDAPVVVGDHQLRWSPYSFSLATGITEDPMLLDRMTGPHGLKGVRDDFLEPRVVQDDPRPGDVFLFWSTVEGTADEMTVASRAAVDVWVSGHQCAQVEESPVVFFEPWGLRDLEPVVTRRPITVDGRASVVVAITISSGQPSRAAVVFGGHPGEAPLSRMRWWHGDRPALHFSPSTTRPAEDSVRFRMAVPPGARGAVFTTPLRLLSTTAIGGRSRAGASTSTRLNEVAIEIVGDARQLIVEFDTAGHRVTDAGALWEPIRWRTEAGTAELADWSDWGLRDFSGVVTYRTRVEVPSAARSATSATLDLSDLVGTARVWINEAEVGTVLMGRTLDFCIPKTAGSSATESWDVVIEVANTLANYAARLPSPYSAMQTPGGGFTAASLAFHAPTRG